MRRNFRLSHMTDGTWRLIVWVLLDEQHSSSTGLLQLASTERSKAKWMCVAIGETLVGLTATIQVCRLRNRAGWTTQKVLHVLAVCNSLSRAIYAVAAIADRPSLIADQFATLCQLAIVVSLASFWADLPSGGATSSRCRHNAALVSIVPLTITNWFVTDLSRLVDIAFCLGILTSSIALAYYGRRASATLTQLPRHADLRLMSSLVAFASTLRGLSLLLRQGFSITVCLALELAPIVCVLYFYRRLPPANTHHESLPLLAIASPRSKSRHHLPSAPNPPFDQPYLPLNASTPSCSATDREDSSGLLYSYGSETSLFET